MKIQPPQTTTDHKQILRETRSILLDKLLEDYELSAADISESVELYYDAQKLRIIPHQ